MMNPLKMLKSWMSRGSQAEISPEPILSPELTTLAVRTSFRSDPSEDSGEQDDDSVVISEKEWDIQERTRERIKAMRESCAENDILRDGEGEAREGASLDWDIATADSLEAANEKLSEQKAAWFDRGAHHMGSSTTPLLMSPDDAMLFGCGRLMRDAGCEWIEPMVRAGFIRPRIESGCRMTLEIVPMGVSVSVDLSAGVSFSSGKRDFADARELESWLRHEFGAFHFHL